jgi:HemX protein
MTVRIEGLLPLLTTLLPVLYALSAAAYVRIYVKEDSTGGRIGPAVLRGAVLVHVAYLGVRGLLEGHLPLASIYDFLSATGLSMALVYLYVEAKEGTPNTGVFIVPIIFMLQVVSTAYGLIPRGVKVPIRPFWFELHTLSAVIAYSAFSVSAVYGILFLVLYREIKSNRFSLFYRRMPPLETLAQMNIRAAGGGLVLLTCAIGLGLGWLHSTGEGSLSDPKIWLTIGVWCIFAFALLAYHRLGWRGPLAIYASLVGFTTLLLSRVLTDVFFHSFHEFR